jgi:hypothetical protein
MEGDYTYCQFDFGIDTLNYYYWVETYILYEDGQSCANRSYYGEDEYIPDEPSDTDVVDAYINGNQIVVYVNIAIPSGVDAFLYDVNGKLILGRAYGYTSKVADVIPVYVASGVYVLKITTGTRVNTFKLLKL